MPMLWHAECANLLLMAERRKRVSAERCLELLELLSALPVETDMETPRGTVFRLARAHHLTAYDAIYLELAARRGIALATRDKALQRAAAAMNVALVET